MPTLLDISYKCHFIKIFINTIDITSGSLTGNLVDIPLVTQNDNIHLVVVPLLSHQRNLFDFSLRLRPMTQFTIRLLDRCG